MTMSTYSDGTSGHQGDASEAAEPSRRKRQVQVFGVVRASGTDGVTWQEVSERLNVHHGVSSSALSMLHMDGHITKLARRRNGCGIYMLPEHVNGEETVARRRN